MPCIVKKKTFELAEKAEAHLVVQVKDNQKELHQQIQHGCSVQKPVNTHQDPLSKGHGRLEQRTYEVFQALPMLKNWHKDWPFIRHIIRVTRMREVLKHGVGQPSHEVCYFVTNAKETEASVYAHLIRSHWAIENTNNYVRDMAFDEDRCTRRVQPSLFARLLGVACNIMRSCGVNNMKNDIYQSTMNFEYMMKKYEKLLG